MALEAYVLRSMGHRKWALRAINPLILGFVVFGACLLGIYTRPVGFLAALWPANAIMLGLILVKPQMARPAGWLAAAVAFFLADILTGASVGKAVLLNLANLFGVGAAYAICVRFPREVVRIRKPGSMLYIALAALVGAGASGVAGFIINPILFDASAINGGLLWFASDFVNYVAILPMILSWPDASAPNWPFRKITAERARITPSNLARFGAPLLALVLCCLIAMVIGGPGAVAFPVPALLWCALVYPVFPTAVLTLLVVSWTLIVLAGAYFPGSIRSHDEMMLVSIRMGVSLIALAPVILATVMQDRNELIAMLHRSRRRLAMTLEAGGIVGTWSSYVANAKLDVNKTLADVFGMVPEDAHRGFEDVLSGVIYPPDREHVLAALKEAIANKAEFQCRFRNLTPHGQLRWFIASGKSVSDTMTGAKQLAGILMDVTESAETEVALHQSNMRFDIVTEAIPQIVWSTDAEGSHDYYNHQWVEFTGVTAEAMGPETWKTLVHPDDWPEVRLAWEESLSTGKTYSADFRLRHHDGTYRWVRVLAKPIRDTDGKITRWYGTATDNDEAKHLELERELVARELDHRIKNLFTLVNGLVSLSVREEPKLKTLAQPFSARLNALHQAHGLITGKPGAESGTLKSLLQKLLKPYDAPRKVFIEGDDVAIDIGAFKSMALVMHELITNSAKYGALLQENAELRVALKTDAEQFTIRWEEHFSSKVAAGDVSGFGSTLVKTIVETQLRGSLMQQLRQDGLSITVQLPRSVVSEMKA